MAYATVADVEVRLGRPLDTAETTTCEARLEDAERLIRSRLPDLGYRVVNGYLSAAVVVMVEADAVGRLLRNPDGIVSETDGTYGYQVGQPWAAGRLVILPEEWALLGVGHVTVLSVRPPAPAVLTEGAVDPLRGAPEWSDWFPVGE